jgi:hypothetical protein
METYKIKKDNDEKHMSHMINGIYKKLIDNTNKSIELSKTNQDYDKLIYKESIVGHRISKFQNEKNRVNHMVGNKAISFSSLVE